MQAIVTADTHLGLSDRYISLEDPGMEVRRAYFRRAFETVVAHAIDIDAALFLHAGDLFDVADPPIEDIAFACRCLKSLERAGVKPFLVRGNHDLSHIIDGEEVFDHGEAVPLDVIAAADLGTQFTETDQIGVETIQVDSDTIAVGGLSYDPALGGPDAGNIDPLQDMNIEHDADRSMLLTHHRVAGHDGGLDGWPIITEASIRALNVDLICSGHVHEASTYAVDDTTVVVPGSTERRKFSKRYYQPGFYQIDLQNEIQVTFQEIAPQPLEKISIAASDLPDGRETDALIEQVKDWGTDDRVIQIELHDPDNRIDRAAVAQAGFVEIIP